MRKFAVLMCVIVGVIGITGCAFGGVSLSAFPDPVFREYLRQYDGGWTEYNSNGEPYSVGFHDGILGDKEIEGITNILLNNDSIKSLKGIEYLTALVSLQIISSQLTELDVSHNVSLTHLICVSYHLKALDVSHNTALTYLDCTGAPLTKLDVSHNLALTFLRCYSDDLASLDVSHNTALEYLDCGYNHLTAIDLSKNTALRSLICENNHLKTLDVSHNIALKYLDCDNNELTELDLSKNTALMELSCRDQKRSDLNVKQTHIGWQVNMKDYVSHPENIDADSISISYEHPVSYDKTTGIITFSKPIRELHYRIITSPSTQDLYVIITKTFSVASLGSEFDDIGDWFYPIICDMNDNSYLNDSGNQLTESDIWWRSYRDYGRKGLTADGNSRLIIRVQADKPGTASFSFNEDIGAKLESLSREELSASDQLSTTQIYSDTHQVSAVLVAPERFPEGKNFPSDTFKVHVKFTDEDGEITEDDLELKLEAAPVILIPGMFDKAVNTFSGIRNMLRAKKFDDDHIDVWDYGFYENPLNRISINYNGLFKKLIAMFKKYAEKGIECTRADIVAYGMGGLLAEKYLSDGDKDSNNGNNWSVCSYKQGMVRRLITVATPHYGTPWADILTGVAEIPLFNGSSTSAGSIIDTWNFAYKYWMDDESMFSEIKSILYELRTTRKSELPTDVPMYAIYGDVSGVHNKIYKLLEAGDRALSDVWSGATILGAAITLDKKAAIVVAAISLSLHYLHDIVGGIDNGIDNGVFKGQAHDRIVSSQSAFGDLTSAVSGFSGEWRYKHSTICKQPEVASKIVRLLQGDLSNFEKITASRSTVSEVPSKAEVSNLSAGTENFRFFEAINLNISPAVLNITGDVTQSATFTVTSNASMKEDIYCVIDNGSESGIFVIEPADMPNGKCEVKLKFTSQDAGVIKVFCFANNPKDTDGTSIYVSNTACMTVLADIDNLDSVNIVSIEFPDPSTVYTNVKSEIPAGLYAVDSEGRYYDVSSPLVGTQWTSTEFARVNDDGCILGLSEGTTTLTATFRGLTASVNVEVSAVLVEEEEDTPPEITTEALSNGITNQPYSLQLTSSGTTPITWTLSGKLPAGLTMSESGLISGTPTKTGKSSFTVKASNTYGEVSQKYTLQVFDPVSISTASLKAGTIGKSYSVTMRAKGTKTIMWSAEGLPNGLTMNAKGKISGKPTVYGMFNVKVKAENGAGSVTKSLTLEIKAIAPKLSGSLKKATLNESYSSGLKVTGSTPITWSIEGNLPDGLALDTSTGIISGTPTSYAKSGYKIILTATNDGGSKSKKITLKVNGKAPKITAKLPQATAGDNYSAELSATGSEPITFAADLPEYLTLEGNTISGTVPDSAKSFKIMVYASNPVKEKVKKNYTVKVSTKKSLSSNLNADNNTDITEINTGRKSEVTANVPALSEKDVYSHSESIIIVAELGEISADKEEMYDFEIKLPDYVREGSELIYIANSDKPSEDDNIVEFYNDTGAEISAVPENRRITISIWLNPETTYNPVIAIKH